MAVGYPSATNVFVPSWEASGHLAVNFSRNVDDFAVNKYSTLTNLTKEKAYYLSITVAEAGRIVNQNDYIWPDGQEAPLGDDNLESFQFVPIEVIRYTYPFTIGDIAVENADWDIIASHAHIHAQKAMSARTSVLLTTALSTASWDASHVKTATVAGGGFWSAGTTANPIIKKTLNTARQLILKDTLAAVKGDDMVLVISPATAMRMAESQEIQEYLKQSPVALAQVRGDVPNQNGVYGLPTALYSQKVVVEETYIITSKKGAATTVTVPVMDDNKALLVSRPGDLMGIENSPSFSTLHLFAREEMNTEVMHDVNNRRQMGRITERIKGAVVASASGVLLTNLFS